MKGGIYAINNTVNGKLYVGSTIDFKVRWRYHLMSLRNGGYRSNNHLKNAWQKYGENNFQFTVLEYVAPEKLLEREQYWMDKTESYNRDKGYNITPEAGRTVGHRHNEELKKNLSIARMGPGNPNYGKVASKETRERMSASRIGKKHTDETRENMRLSKIGNIYPRGENNGSAKLSEKDVLEIVALLKTEQHRHAGIAKIYNVSECVVTNINNGKSWAYLTGGPTNIRRYIPRGEEMPCSKLTTKEVIEIKNLFAKGMSCAKIATMYPVGSTAVNDIGRGRTWKHI